MSFSYSPEELFECFDRNTVQRGTDYFFKENVLQVASNSTGNVVYGRVKGSGRNTYNLDIKLSRERGKLEIRSYCSCPVRVNCKHALAILLANMTQINSEVNEKEEDKVLQSRDVEKWLGKLEQELSSKSVDTANDVAPNTVNRLLYVFVLKSYSYGQQLSVNYESARQLKAGGYGKSSRYSPENIVNSGRAGFISTDDEKILRQLYARKVMDHIDCSNLSASGGGEILAKMLATGRCFWGDKNNIKINPGPKLKGRMHWQVCDDGAQQLVFEAEDKDACVLPTKPPYYFNERKRECGLLEVDVPTKAVELIQKAPPVTMEEMPTVTDRLQPLIRNLPKPQELKIKIIDNIKPVPHAHFKMHSYEVSSSFHYGSKTVVEPVIEITLNYDRLTSSLLATGVTLTHKENNSLIKYKRNLSEENRVLDLMEELEIIPLRILELDDSLPQDLFGLPFPDFVDQHDVWISFMMTDLPVLEKNGWQVTYEKDFPYSISTVDDWHMAIDETVDNQWFDLSLDVEVNGERYNLVNIITSLLGQNPRMFKDINASDSEKPENVLLKLQEGGLLAIPYERIEGIVKILLELFDKQGEGMPSLKLPKWRAAELNELQAQGLEWQGGELLKASADRLSKFKGIKAKAAPKNFKAELRDYQKDGLAWLQFLREYEFHGVLADDMGLGKTVQTLAHIATEKAEGRLDKPVLVIAPTSLMYNWRHEAEQFAPHLKLLTLHGPDRKKDFDKIADYDIVLSTYPLLGRDEKVLLNAEWHMLILDEAQNIKNPKTKATKVACQINAKHRLCLTGTPLENHLGELWSIFNFLMPGLLGGEKQFRQLFRTPVEKQGDTDRAQRLAKRLAPFMIRRKKDEVVKELPAKTEIIRSVGLEGAQRDMYETVRVSMQKKVRDSISQLGMNKSHIIVLDALLKLRQICCDPRLLKTDAKAKTIKSAKLDLLMSLLPELLEEGRKVLLFSQFTSMLTLIEDELKKYKIKYAKLTGNTRNREKPIAAFQKGEVPLFLISLKAGGTGLNLTTADTVIHYDPWWNPAVEAQATDRAHRIGQDKPVFVYKLLTEETVEARIQTMQESKRKLAEGLFDSAGKGKLPGAKDLEVLFEGF